MVSYYQRRTNQLILYDPNQTRLAQLVLDLEDSEIDVFHAVSKEAELGDILNQNPNSTLLTEDSVHKEDLFYLKDTVGIFVIVVTDGMDLSDWRDFKEKKIPVLKRPITPEKVIEVLRSQKHDLSSVKKSSSTLRTIIRSPQQEERRMEQRFDIQQDDVRKVEGGGVRTFRQVVAPIYSTKGGVGKTTISINFAANCAQHPDVRRVCLVDGDSQYGDIARFLNQRIEYSLYDLTKMLTSASTWNELEALLPKHSTGFYYVPAPKSPTEVMSTNHEQMVNLLQLLKRHFDVIIIDLSPNLSDLTVASFDESTDIYVVGTTDIINLNEISEFTTILPKLRIEKNKVKLIMNRCQKNTGVQIRDVKGAIPFPVVAMMNEEVNIQKAANHHQIVSLKEKKADFSQGIRQLLQDVNLQVTDHKTSFLSKFFSRKGTAL
jgi:MinD-like ATPase involved in chromosome partitioning or flagellar assembly